MLTFWVLVDLIISKREEQTDYLKRIVFTYLKKTQLFQQQRSMLIIMLLFLVSYNILGTKEKAIIIYRTKEKAII